VAGLLPFWLANDSLVGVRRAWLIGACNMHTAAKIRTREGLIIVIMANFLVFRDLPDPSCTTWWAVQLNCYCRTGGLLYIG